MVLTIKDAGKKYNIAQDTLRYYEQAGMIPPVIRTAWGIRDCQDKELAWVELALCMRSAGLPVEAIANYVRLTQHGGGTLADRPALLRKQREVLLERQRQTEATRNRLNYKINIYEDALKTGTLNRKKEGN